MKVLNSVFAMAAALAMTGSTYADVIYSGNFSSLGALESPGVINTSFNATSGNATLDFELAGYLSLDGYGNGDTDTFTLTVNGDAVFSGSFNLGGGGTNAILSNSSGATALVTTNGATDDPHNSTQTTWDGGTVEISAPIALVSGTNTIQFAYNGVDQGLDDEGWGVNQVTVTSAVPETNTTALMAAGLALMGLVARYRKQV